MTICDLRPSEGAAELNPNALTCHRHLLHSAIPTLKTWTREPNCLPMACGPESTQVLAGLLAAHPTMRDDLWRNVSMGSMARMDSKNDIDLWVNTASRNPWRTVPHLKA